MNSLYRQQYEELLEGSQRRRCLKWLLPVLGSVCFSSIFLFLTFLISQEIRCQDILSDHEGCPSDCFFEQDECNIRLVESIPQGLVYNSTIHSISTYKAWKILLRITESKLELASSYWSLRGKDVFKDASDKEGEDIFKRLVKATENGISIDIAQNLQDNPDTADLSKIRGVQVRSLNFTNLMGAGILHTKLWISDRKHFYVGSANFDWRSLTQVKELGVLATNCSCLARDMAKIWTVYWLLGGAGKNIPSSWPEYLATKFNAKNPIDVKSSHLSAYLSSSPPPFCPEGRESDIRALINVIEDAQEFVHVAVMDYFPQTIYTKRVIFWPVIDDALRRAAIERGVRVKILLSLWDHTRPDMRDHLLSLTVLNGTQNDKVFIEGKFFKVPAFTPEQAKIPFARVNHNKYMVSDKSGYIGTSNWSGDYFINTGGIGFIFQDLNSKNRSHGLWNQLRNVFERDWHSSYASYV